MKFIKSVILLLVFGLMIQARPPAPKTADKWIKQAENEIYKKNFDAALNDLGEAFKIAPNNAMAFYWRGCVNYAQNKYEQAIADHTKAIALNPRYKEFFYSRGLDYAYKTNPDYTLAIDDFNRAIALMLHMQKPTAGAEYSIPKLKTGRLPKATKQKLSHSVKTRRTFIFFAE